MVTKGFVVKLTARAGMEDELQSFLTGRSRHCSAMIAANSASTSR